MHNEVRRARIDWDTSELISEYWAWKMLDYNRYIIDLYKVI